MQPEERPSQETERNENTDTKRTKFDSHYEETKKLMEEMTDIIVDVKEQLEEMREREDSISSEVEKFKQTLEKIVKKVDYLETRVNKQAGKVGELENEVRVIKNNNGRLEKRIETIAEDQRQERNELVDCGEKIENLLETTNRLESKCEEIYEYEKNEDIDWQFVSEKTENLNGILKRKGKRNEQREKRVKLGPETEIFFSDNDNENTNRKREINDNTDVTHRKNDTGLINLIELKRRLDNNESKRCKVESSKSEIREKRKRDDDRNNKNEKFDKNNSYCEENDYLENGKKRKINSNNSDKITIYKNTVNREQNRVIKSDNINDNNRI